MKNLNLIALIMIIFASGGCSTLQINRFVADAGRPEEYHRFFKEVDRAVTSNKVRDDAGFSVARFPYLRADRFSVELKSYLKTAEQRNLWVRLLQENDLRARKKEVQNLPELAFKELAGLLNLEPERGRLLKQVENYSNKLLERDRMHPDYYQTLDLAVKERSEYSEIMRLLGIYPIYQLPVLVGTVVVYEEFRDWHQEPLNEIDVLNELKFYSSSQSVSISQEELRRMFKTENRDALGIPRLNKNEIQSLFRLYAPVIVQDTAADYDRFGELSWDNGKVSIRTDTPVVYNYVTYAIIKKKTALQLNYAFWFTERAGNKAPWIEHGPLDGLTVRLTLDEYGTPLVLDVMNNCGCYYFAAPRKDKVVKIIKKAWALDPLVPTWLPDNYPDKKLFLRVNSGWHQIHRIYTGRLEKGTIDYRMEEYDVLESLPKGDGQYEGVFNRRGIMKDSSRIEPFIFFPMGIYDIGYMRQRGHHAIKMIGKAHFTDPGLLEEDFVFK